MSAGQKSVAFIVLGSTRLYSRQLALLLLSFSVIAVGFAQTKAPVESQTAAILMHMGSPDMATRHAGLDDLIKMISEGQTLGFDPQYGSVLNVFLMRHPEQADRLKLGLINSVKTDDEAFMSGKAVAGTYSEADTEHYATEIEMVASLDDERAIPALVGAMTTGGMATSGLLKYGQESLNPVLNQLHNPNPLIRSTALDVGIAILKNKNDSGAKAQIFSLIQAALSDREFLMRSAALTAIGNLSDREQFVPVLRNVAEHDPFKASGETRYPLRDRANSLLGQIAKDH